MGAGAAWFYSVASVLLLVLALHHLGWNASAEIGTVLRGAAQLLGQPLTVA